MLNSSLFYAYFVAYSDCFHLSQTLVSGFPIPKALTTDSKLAALNKKLMRDLKANAEAKTIRTRDGDEISYAEFFAVKSKHLVDDIDRILGSHFKLTDQELEFIIAYDLKYRIGADDED